jgi:PBSX family phage terminase large subunit
MELTPWQKTVVQSPKRFRVLLAGRRAGKTILAIEEMVFNAVTKKDARIVYIAPTFQSARDIAWEQLKNRTREIQPKLNEARLELELPNKHATNSKIFLRSWDAVETLRGQYFDFIVLDEVAQYRGFERGWNEVLRPTLTDRKGRVLFISTPLGFNHFYTLYNFQDPDYESFKFTSYDNPHLPKEEIDKASEEMTEDRFAQEYLADFRKTEGLVYKEFDRGMVTTEEPKTVTDTLVGIDWGFTNPTSVHRIRKDQDAHYWIDSEFYKTKQTTEQIIEYARTLKPNKVYPDPAEPDRIEQARRAGLNVREVSKDIPAGIDSVRELLKQGRLHIHPDCVNLIFEFESYRYPEKKTEQNEKEVPIKENDHALDEIRYVLHNQEPTPQIQYKVKTY